MTANRNHAWRLARTPLEGWPTDGDFNWTEGDISEPGPGQAVGETLLLSLDPYQWNRRRNGTEQPVRFVTEEPYLGSLGAHDFS